MTFKVADLVNSGNFIVQTVEAKVGQNGSFMDVTDEMSLEISEDCSVYVRVTDTNGNVYEKNKAIKCFDKIKPTLNAAVSDGLLTVQALDRDSGIKVIYVNGYEFKDVTNGTLQVRLSQFEAGYEYFTIQAMDNVGNVSDIYKTKNPYYKAEGDQSQDNPASQLPVSAAATAPASATAPVTEHMKVDANGNMIISDQADTSPGNKTPAEQKKEEFAKADAEEAALAAGENVQTDKSRGKEFYTIEAASGKVFYLVIDRDGENELVYFLTEITENDLLNVTTDNSETLPKNSAALESAIPTDDALPNNNTEVTEPEPEPAGEVTEEPADTEEPAEEPVEEPKKNNPWAAYIIIGVLSVIAIAGGYYFKVLSHRNDEDFVEDEDEEEDEEYETGYVEKESDEEDYFGNPAADWDMDEVADTIDADTDTVNDEE